MHDTDLNPNDFIHPHLHMNPYYIPFSFKYSIISVI